MQQTDGHDPATSRLMPGEDRRSPYEDDAEHWVRVYEEMIEIETDSLAQLEERDGGSNHSETNGAHENTERLTRHLAELRGGLDYWRERLGDLKRDGAL